VVWSTLAEQEQPVRRKVALKVIKLGMDTKSVIARFEAERQALALMEHPNIARVLDAGATNTGRPYFVMELVRGLKITEHCDQYKLPTAERLNLFIQVCQAIQHAHQKGIIHRDIKPSNILVTLHDGVPVPKVIDFGIAKATQGKLTDQTLFTAFEQLIGTPAYMSPEQAEMSGLDIDTRSDVYALGVLLYELLTGQTPFDTKELMAAGLDAMRRTIREKDPSRPSTRLRTMLAADLTTVAKQRQCEPSKLVHLLGGDLDWVVMKALEKDRTRRYETANGLAMEIRRYLAGDPVIARPITPVAQAWRWCRRNPSVAALGVSLILVFALGFMGTLWQWRQAVHNERVATEQRQRIDQNLYDSEMSFAQQAWDDGDLGRTLGLLEAHRPGPGEPDRRGFEWFYFWNLCKGDQRLAMTGHVASVNSVAFSADGKRLATGSVGDPVQIWDTGTGKIVKTLPEQTVFSLAFAPSGQMLGVGSKDRIAVWNLQTDQVVFKHEEVLGQFHIAFSPVGTLLALAREDMIKDMKQEGRNDSVEVWDYVSSQRKQTLPEAGGRVTFSPRGNLLATRNWDQGVKIWDLTTGQLVHSLKQTEHVIDFAFSSDGQTLATSRFDPEVQLWDVITAKQIGLLTSIQHQVWSLAFSPDDKVLATGGADQTISLWDVSTRQRTELLKGHRGEVMSVAFSPDGRTLASGSKDKTAMLWSVHPDRAVMIVSNVVYLPVFSGDGRLVAASFGENQVAVWDVPTFRLKAVFADASAAVTFSSDGNNLLTRGENYLLRWFDVKTQTARETISCKPMAENIANATLSPDGRIFAAGSHDGTLTLYDAKAGAVLATIPHAHDSVIFRLAFSPNGTLLATVGRGAMPVNVTEPKIWDVVTHRLVAAPVGHTAVILSAVFSPDGKTLVTGSTDNSIRFWDTNTWKEIPPSLGHRESVSSLDFSPDGKRLASTSMDGTLKLWNVATRRELASLKLDSRAGNITFSPDGQTLAVWYWNNSLRLWRAPDPEIGRH